MNNNVTKEELKIREILNEALDNSLPRPKYNDIIEPLYLFDYDEDVSNEYLDNLAELYKNIEICNKLPYVKWQFELSYLSRYNVINEAKTSYPIARESEYTIKEISKKLQYPYAFFKAIYRHSEDKIACFILMEVPFQLVEKYDFDMLKKAFETCGYFLASSKRIKTNESGDYIFRFQYEPYFYDNRKRIYIPEIIYHVTNRINKDSILKDGFIISHQSNIYEYPPRNYFFIYYNEKLMRGVMYASNKCDKMLQNQNPVCIFYINSKSTKARFYSDPVYHKSHTAIYTYDNISPNSITNIEDKLF